MHTVHHAEERTGEIPGKKPLLRVGAKENKGRKGRHIQYDLHLFGRNCTFSRKGIRKEGYSR